MPAHQRLKDKITEKRIFIKRIFLAVFVVLVMVGVLVSRYIQLQVFDHETYQTQSEKNRVHVISVAPKRGLIFDRNGVLLAENKPSYTLHITKESVPDLDATLALLTELIPLREQDLDKFKKRIKYKRPFEAVPLKFRLSEEDIATIAVNRFRLPGVEVTAQLVRNYPHDKLFAHVLGYVGRINDKEQARIDEVNYSATHHIGKRGVERYYEDVLHGIVGYQNVETNARGRVIRVLDEVSPVPGENIILSLDIRLQKVAYDALANERGSVVALDPNNGEVLAMVSTPSFDPNLFVNGISRKDYSALRDSPDIPLFNRSTQGQYPPASTVKPIYGLAGLYHKVISPATVVSDPGWYRLPNEKRLFRDWKRGGHSAYIDLHGAVQQSCDTYFYDLAYRLGIDRIHSFTKQFGLGEKTGIDLVFERKGLLPSREWKRATKRSHWFPGETLNVGIGQGLMLATPLQLAQATAVMATRGNMYQPRLLIKREDMELVPRYLGQKVQADASDWDYVIKSMESVLHSRKGTAKKAGQDLAYRMAGKTGTAQVIGIAQGERYDADKIEKRKRDHALFIGFAPADNPQIAVAVVVENGEHGSTTAAPIARKVMDAYILGREKNDSDKK